MANLKSGVRATLVELFTRIIKVNDREDRIYTNDVDNLYPNRIERIINSSPTASRATKIMGNYIGGNGLVNELQDIVVNERKNYKLSNIASIAGQVCAKQGGVFIHVGYGFDLEGNGKIVPRTLDVLDYKKCRITKEDDDNNEGFIIYKDFSEQKFSLNKKEKTRKFYPFNKNEDVVIAQIRKDYKDKKGKDDAELIEMLPHYRGQVFYLNLTPEYKYALSPIDSVYNDADSEYRISVYENSEIRKGFLGKTAILTKGLDEENIDGINQNIKKWLGADGEDTSSVFRLDFGNDVEDVSKSFSVVQVKPQIDPDLFTEIKKQLKLNILGACNSIPEILVLASSGLSLGQSGEAYKQAKLFYNEQTSYERWKISETLTYLGFPCEIKPIIEEEKTLSTNEQN